MALEAALQSLGPYASADNFSTAERLMEITEMKLDLSPRIALQGMF